MWSNSTSLRAIWRYVSLAVMFALSGCQSGSNGITDSPQAGESEQNLSQPQASLGVNRGVVACDDDGPCYPTPSVDAKDVEIAFVAVVDGRLDRVLHSGETLNSGERFTILVRAIRDTHFYLFHADPTGGVAELSMSGGRKQAPDCQESNLLSAGQTLQLPAPGEHFSLYGPAGNEQLIAVVAHDPLCDAQQPSAKAGDPARYCALPGVSCTTFVIQHLSKA